MGLCATNAARRRACSHRSVGQHQCSIDRELPCSTQPSQLASKDSPAYRAALATLSPGKPRYRRARAAGSLGG